VRGDFTAGGRAHYGRDVGNGTLPELSTHSAVLEAARQIAPGEAARLAAEGAAAIPMALPSAAQVATLLAQVELEATASQKAQAFTDQRQNEVSTLYPEAQRLAVSLCNTIEFNLSECAIEEGLDTAGQRRIARDWGVVYIYDANETPDEGDPNAANTTLPNLPANQ